MCLGDSGNSHFQKYSLSIVQSKHVFATTEYEIIVSKDEEGGKSLGFSIGKLLVLVCLNSDMESLL